MKGDRVRGDHFSGVSAAYAAFRPTYPDELFDAVAAIAPARRRVWDCGAGTGQATLDLAERFDRVIATDASAEQIRQAPPHARVEWHVAPAEHAPINSGTIDLTAVAQALHWFDHDRFYDEVRRVSVPGAAIAAWTYGAPSMDGALGEALHHFMYVEIDPYWPPERRHIEAGYRSIPFPFERIEIPPFTLEHHWTAGELAGYLRSMSATARYVAAHGSDPVATFERELPALWPGGERRSIRWPLIVLAGRV